ncbi:unnamed protein product [Heligmosomoides polygyrus]|uniref:Uncharacterized protein n=1 Tax=Heligmosomoides polygyrus TaxID=6339 RepID=A0A3P8CE69_HELPZ|nr:unnamed protein product [Heligmosomoides polygyrus]
MLILKVIGQIRLWRSRAMADPKGQHWIVEDMPIGRNPWNPGALD